MQEKSKQKNCQNCISLSEGNCLFIMDIRRRIVNHHKRWNITIDEQQAFNELKNRLLNLIGSFLNKSHWKDSYDKVFAHLYGIKIPFDEISQLVQYNSFGDCYIYSAIEKAETSAKLVTTLQLVCIAVEEVNPGEIESLANCIEAALRISTLAEFRIVKHNNSIKLYPAGAKLLDEGAVNDVLGWLENYPNVAKHFQQALQIYSEKDTGKYRNLLDNLRFAIEQLLKEVLGNKKSLENQEQALLTWLSKKRVHQQIINSYQQLLFGAYKMYQNDAVKHNEAFAENEIEFIIYMTGTFMRLVLQLA